MDLSGIPRAFQREFGTWNLGIIYGMQYLMNLMPIPNENIGTWWSQVLPWAEEFCQHSQGSYDPQYILERLNDSLMQLWLIMNDDVIFGVVLTEIRQTKIKECIIVVTTGREMESWVHLLKTLEKYAMLMGCTKMVGIARPGWEKILKPLGYKKMHVQLEREL